MLQRVTCEAMSDFFTKIHREEGVQIRVLEGVQKILGSERVNGVQLENGEVIDANLVLVGIGVVPNTALAEDAGLAINNGIEVNQFCQTSNPQIYAMGDCTSFVHPRYDRRVRLESVQNANDQAAVAARSICGQGVAYDAVPWFWSDQYDVKLQIAGLTYDADQIIVRNNPQTPRSIAIFYAKEDRLVGVEAANSPRVYMMGKKLIVENRAIDTSQLANNDIPLGNLIK